MCSTQEGRKCSLHRMSPNVYNNYFIGGKGQLLVYRSCLVLRDSDRRNRFRLSRDRHYLCTRLRKPYAKPESGVNLVLV
jgi:hypothetical protein